MARKVKRLTRKDKSNTELFENSAATKVSGSLSLGIGVIGTIVFYLIIFPFKGTYFGDLFYERGFIQYVQVLLTAWAAGILFIKLNKTKKQKEAMHFNLLPEEISYEINGSNIPDFEDHIWSLKTKHNESFLITRILKGLSHFDIRRKHSDVREIMTSQSEIDMQTVDSSYTIIKVFIWAIPILGFVGTVMGISGAIGSFASSLAGAQDLAVLKEGLGSVTGGLGLAFDTTLLALILSLILMFPTSMLQAAEEDFLNSVDEYCNEHFIKRLNADTGGSDQFTTEEVANAVQLVLAGTQGVFIQKLNGLQDSLIELHNNQIEFARNLNDVTNQQVSNIKEAEKTTQKGTMVMKKTFDDLIKNLTHVSETMTGVNIGRRQKKKGWLW